MDWWRSWRHHKISALRARAASDRLPAGKLEAVAGNRVIVLAKRTLKDFVDDDCPHLAAAIAYYSLFSLFPLILGLVAIMGFALGSSMIQDELSVWIAGYLPGSGGLITGTVRNVVRAREEAGILAVLGFLWSAMAVFAAVRKALNAAWDVERRRPLLRQKLLDLTMLGAVGALFLLSTSLTTVYRLLRQWHWQVPLLDIDIAHQSLLALGGAVVPPALTFFVFLMVYRMVPFTEVRWTSAALGAVLATVLFELGKNLFVWYAQNFARYELVYGSLGTVIGLLTWIYLSAIILLLGAELAAEHGKMADELSQQDGEETW
jgi:membrane protein